ncbi:NAD(P)-dependent oxidoreductase [Thermoproteus tenax]|uniref:3-hydroxyisobutyrate dehydrogenase related enzyme n=1 Tax=Thermoproteus tenax (strain ATCC 35583 / DSM 2078 / JCM 9277 / NBRC 100435 / Kra 1) TaxID=768679 RepID=G4RJP4_THETK|nr:3-hydroxyisobutyrate dehydrogenase related enzyme [Thermoproteus tenax Kra 1]
MQMRVSVVGLGRMGRGMARNLARRGVEVTGFDISSEAAASSGVPLCRSLEQCFEADYVLLALPTGREVLDVLRRAPKSASPVVVDTTTQSMSELRSVLSVADRMRYLTCRVERGPREAEEGRLVLYVGGPPELYRQSEGLLRMLGEPIYVGSHEAATALKLISVYLLTSYVSALAEAAAVLKRSGLDPEGALTALSKGGAASAQLTSRMPPMLRGAYAEGFSASAALTAVRQFRELASELGLRRLPVADRLEEVLRDAISSGVGALDIAELEEYIEQKLHRQDQ